MEQVQEEEKQKLEFTINKTDLSTRLFKVYGMLAEQDSPGDLLATLMTGTESYFWAQKEAYDTADQKGRGRVNYDSNVMSLMDYRIDENVNISVEQSSIDLFTSALNNYLADKQELPEQTGRNRNTLLKNVKALMIQLISQGLYDILTELKIPEYVKPMVDRAYEFLSIESDKIFNNWIEDLKETGNEFLIDYINTIGPSFLSYTTRTKSQDTYSAYLSQYLDKIKNPEILYARYKLRRGEFNSVTKNIEKRMLYDSFEMTADEYSKAQARILSEFQLRFNDDINSQYIMRAIHGID